MKIFLARICNAPAITRERPRKTRAHIYDDEHRAFSIEQFKLFLIPLFGCSGHSFVWPAALSLHLIIKLFNGCRYDRNNRDVVLMAFVFVHGFKWFCMHTSFNIQNMTMIVNATGLHHILFWFFFYPFSETVIMTNILTRKQSRYGEITSKVWIHLMKINFDLKWQFRSFLLPNSID